MTLRVLHYTELKDRLDRSGIGTSVDHQRRALSENDEIELVYDFDAYDYFNPPNVDILHTNFVGPKTLSIMTRLDVPIASHAHVTSEDFGESFRFSSEIQPITGKYLKTFYRQSDVLICPSNYTKKVVEEYNTGNNIEVVTNGVDIESLSGYQSLREEYRNKYNLMKTVVFTLGNVFERKGLSTFIETAKMLPEFEFVWFGPYDSGPQASKEVRKYVQNPPENVTFTGWIEDKRGAFAAGDIYFFPTKEENQGIATLEAMSCGIPVVLNDIPVFREYYENEYDCIISSSVDEFAQNIKRIDEEDNLARRIGQNAQSTAQEHSLQRVSDRLKSIYKNLV